MRQILEHLLTKQDLTREKAFNVMLSIMSGEHDDAQISGFQRVIASTAIPHDFKISKI